MTPQLCVGAIATVADSLLLIRRGTPPGEGQWSLPGGRVEAGELMQSAVIRELREETGVVAVCDGLVGWVQRIGADYHYVIFDFAVTVMDQSDLAAGDDAADVRWVPLGEVVDLPLVDGLAEFLADHNVISTLA